MPCDGALRRSVRSAWRRRLLASVAVFIVASPITACGETPSEVGSLAPTTATIDASATTQGAKEPVTHDFVIPDGTSAAIVRGDDVDIIPRQLDVRVGDRIRVRNDDVEIVRLGIFDVKPGETVSMNFNTAGTMEGEIFGKESGGCGVPSVEAETFTINIAA